MLILQFFLYIYIYIYIYIYTIYTNTGGKRNVERAKLKIKS